MDSQNEFEVFSRLVDDFRDVFNTPQGQRVIEHLEGRFHVLKTTLSVDLYGAECATVDPNLALVNEGQRSVVLYIRDLIRTDLDALRDEHNERSTSMQNNLASVIDEVEKIGV